MTTFTPGPWKYDPDDGTVCASPDQIGNSTLMCDYRGPVIADIAYSVNQRECWPTVSRQHALSEAEANARLIAEAPELLKYLEMMVKWAEATVASELGEDSLPRGFDNARATIAKVRDVA